MMSRVIYTAYVTFTDDARVSELVILSMIFILKIAIVDFIATVGSVFYKHILNLKFILFWYPKIEFEGILFLASLSLCVHRVNMYGWHCDRFLNEWIIPSL